jgi:anti-sigma factor RsiW
MPVDRDRLDPEERALDDALSRLPRHAAPELLVQRLRARWQQPSRWRLLVAVPASIAAAALVLLLLRVPASPAGLVHEAVNDHLRLVAADHPAEIESSEYHQVKPWFTGRLDFAPAVAFTGDDEFPLVGGAVGYFVDRKCAVFLFRHRLHHITLLVVPAAGLPWPTREAVHDRGFNVLLWQREDLGYALVSDTDASELEALSERVTP